MDQAAIGTETAAFPRYTRGELIADAIVHGVGLSLAAIALPLMIGLVFSWGSLSAQVSVALYALTAALMLGCSALYNGLRKPALKHLFRRFDRAAIFLMIAGTYTPLALTKIDQPLGAELLVFEWSLAALGATLAICFPRRAERLFVPVYLLMGWAIVVALVPLLSAVGPVVFATIVAGGVIYSAGVGLHAATRLKFHNALWHVCVLGAAACHYVAILNAVVLSEAS